MTLPPLNAQEGNTSSRAPGILKKKACLLGPIKGPNNIYYNQLHIWIIFATFYIMNIFFMFPSDFPSFIIMHWIYNFTTFLSSLLTSRIFKSFYLL